MTGTGRFFCRPGVSGWYVFDGKQMVLWDMFWSFHVSEGKEEERSVQGPAFLECC